MARHYGQVRSDIWRNPDFRRLSSSAQRVYLMLITQADITSAGTLAITIRRWAAYSPDTPSHALSDALSELASARFIVVDEDTEELLVRKFVKWDGGHTNEKRREAIAAAANAIESSSICAAMAAELDKLEVPHALSDRASDRASDTPRVVVTERTYVPQPRNRKPETTTPPAQAQAGETVEQRTNRLAKTYTDRVKLSNFPAVRGVVRKAVRAEYDDPSILAALGRMADDGRSVTTDTLRHELEGFTPNGRSATAASSKAEQWTRLGAELASADEPRAIGGSL